MFQIITLKINFCIVLLDYFLLNRYLPQAQEKIAYYNQNPPTTQAQVEDLAKQLTIAKIGALTTDSTGATIDFASYYKSYGIKVTYNIYTNPMTYETTVNCGELNSTKISGNVDSKESDYKLNTIKTLINKTFG